MTCVQINANLSAYIYGELTKDEVMAVHQHLGQCEQCALEEIELRKTMRRINRYELMDLPADFDQQLNQRISNEKRAVSPKKRMAKYRQIVWAIAATVVLTLGIEFLAWQFIFTPTLPHGLAQFQTRQSLFEPTKRSVAAVKSLRNKYVKKFQSRSTN